MVKKESDEEEILTVSDNGLYESNFWIKIQIN